MIWLLYRVVGVEVVAKICMTEDCGQVCMTQTTCLLGLSIVSLGMHQRHTHCGKGFTQCHIPLTEIIECRLLCLLN